MVEIFLLYFLCKRIGAIVRAKGRKAIGYQFMTVALWFGCEFAGLFGGAIISGEVTALAYVIGLSGAAIGALSAFLIARSLSPIGQDSTGGFPVAAIPYAQQRVQ